VIDHRDRSYIFHGRLVRATFVGTFRGKKGSGAVGTGGFQLQVAGNDSRMSGWCTWHDADTDLIEASIYEWRRLRSGD